MKVRLGMAKKLEDTNIVKFAESIGKNTSQLGFYDFVNYMRHLFNDGERTSKKVVKKGKKVKKTKGVSVLDKILNCKEV